MTEDQPANNAGPRIPRQRQPARNTPEANANPHTRPPPKRKTKTELAIEEAIARLVADAPPLSPEQRTRLAELFSINQHQPGTRRR